MGMFFSNVHIRLTDAICAADAAEAVTARMIAQGYTVTDAQKPDAEVFICTSARPWISVCSDSLDFAGADDTRALIAPLSDSLKTDVLAVACFDSDYLFMNLVNTADGTDAWMNVGRNPDGPMPRRSNPSAWKKKVRDFDAFKAAVKADNVFAEEVFVPMEPCLDLPFEQACLCPDCIDETYECIRLAFSMPASAAPAELPKLIIPRYGGMPCRIGTSNVVSALNKGGASRGLAVAFSGAYVENEEITFSHVQLEYGRGSDKPTIIPISLDKRQTADGMWIYYAELPELRLREKVPDGLPWRRKMDMEFEREVAVRFTPEGNPRKVLDITVHFIPLKNPAGQCGWNVWVQYGSKQKYIEENNRRWGELCKGPHGPRAEEVILNADDYDLD